jgi:hypothetical protein
MTVINAFGPISAWGPGNPIVRAANFDWPGGNGWVKIDGDWVTLATITIYPVSPLPFDLPGFPLIFNDAGISEFSCPSGSYSVEVSADFVASGNAPTSISVTLYK